MRFNEWLELYQPAALHLQTPIDAQLDIAAISQLIGETDPQKIWTILEVGDELDVAALCPGVITGDGSFAWFTCKNPHHHAPGTASNTEINRDDKLFRSFATSTQYNAWLQWLDALHPDMRGEHGRA